MVSCEATLALLMFLAPASTGDVSADSPARRADREPARPSSSEAAAPAPVPPATVLSALSADIVDGRLRIIIRGNGRVEPAVARYARGMPPRVLIDIPGVASELSAVTQIGRLGVERVRIQTPASGPPRTRILVDLSRQELFAVWREGEQGEDLAILFGDVPEVRASAAPPDSEVHALRVTPEHAAPSTAAVDPPPTEPSEEPPWMRSVARTTDEQSPQATLGIDSAVGRATGGPGFFGLRGFRAAVGVGYDRWNTEVRNGYALDYDNRVTSPLLTLQGSLWLVDPQILAVDVLADLRLDWQRYNSSVLETKTTDTLENYRVNMLVLSGRGSPLAIYFDRATSLLDQRQNPLLSGDVLTLSQTGRQTTRGFSWDLNNTRLPHVSASGSLTDRDNVGSFLSGWDSNSRQERLDLRADKEHRLLRYDVSYSHDKSRFVYPLATLTTQYAADVVRGSTYITPRPGLSVTAGARMTRFDAGRTDDLDRRRSFMGAGGNVGMQWRWAPRWRFEAHYNASTNESEIALSQTTGTPAPTAEEARPIAARRRFLYQDFDGRMTYTASGESTVASLFVRGLSLDPVAFGTPTLDTLTMAGGQIDVHRGVAGFDLTMGGEAAAGRSSSSRGDTAPYHEASGRIRASRRLAAMTFAAGAGIRDTGGSFFYPVTGRSWHGEVDLTYDASRRVQLRGSASRSFLLRDVVFQRGDDHTESYRAGLRGPRFDVAFEHSDTQSTAEGLLETAWLADADPAELLATRPELFGFLYASRQLRRAVDGRVTIRRGFDVFARGRLDRLQLPSPQGGGFLNQNVGQVGAILGVRQLQVEIGWEYLEYWSHLVSTVDRRFQVRIRRDLMIR